MFGRIINNSFNDIPFPVRAEASNTTRTLVVLLDSLTTAWCGMQYPASHDSFSIDMCPNCIYSSINLLYFVFSSASPLSLRSKAINRRSAIPRVLDRICGTVIVSYIVRHGQCHRNAFRIPSFLLTAVYSKELLRFPRILPH